MRGLVVGMGEVGSAHYRLLHNYYETDGTDIYGDYKDGARSGAYEIIHICLNYAAMGHAEFLDVVKQHIKKFAPKLVDVCSTVRPGTCEEIGSLAVHSTTRGLHPNLDRGLRAFVKHIGGPNAQAVAEYFNGAGIKTSTFPLARTTELSHILHNSIYGVNLIFADEMAKICRQHDVDYTDVLKYVITGNDGFDAIGQSSKRRMVLTPPGGRIGGHCVRQGAALIPQELRTPLLDMVARYKD